MRCRRASKSSRPSRATTISPSKTTRRSGSALSAATSSGKKRVSVCALFDWSTTRSPSRKARQRKPSHFGSNDHSSPGGSASTESASIGAYGGRTGRSSVGKSTAGSIEPQYMQDADGRIERSQSATAWPGRDKTSEGLEERPGLAGPRRTSEGLEERPGFPGAPRTLGGVGGH